MIYYYILMIDFFFFFQLLWNYKLNLTTDPKFESVAVEVCKTTIPEVLIFVCVWKNIKLAGNLQFSKTRI